ncbi:MAG: right-handed parallel beta-helix repeat-containing protein [Candidatus Hydrogenedentes bacterium]|nr:right-handed parallel beta-helix repeat-containing protein [Candidatus Hydrogenedentota bacterium]
MNRLNRLIVAGWCAVLLSLPAVAAPGAGVDGTPAPFFVSTAGDDSWSGRIERPNGGRTDGPFATVERARDAARGLAAGTAKRIVILPGEYAVVEPILFDARDNALTIEGGEGGRVFLYGGKRVTGWQPDGDGLYCAELPGVQDGSWDFRALVVNGRLCPRARLPEQGRFTHLTEFAVPWMGTTGGGWKRKPTEEELTRLAYRPEDLGPWLDIKNAEITVFHMWDESMVGVAAIDREAGVLTFSSPTRHPAGAFRVQDYVVWNLREGMTTPGQWYLDRTGGKVVYWPLPGEDMARAEVFAPVAQTLLSIRGTDDAPVRDVTIRGLTLSVTTTPLKAGGFGAGVFEGALSAANGEGCLFSGIEVVNVGGQGIKTWKLNRSRLERCQVHHTGACGMMARGDGLAVEDNHVHHVGRAYPSAIGLWGGGAGNVYGHNDIHDTPYSGICCGGRETRIEHNRIHDVMQELHDGAAIYSSKGKGIVLRGNFVYDIVDTGGYGASAYYLDEQCEGCLVEGNLSFNVARPSHNHWAQNNTIRNNVFIVEGDASLTFARSRDYTFEQNVVCAGGAIAFSNIDAITVLRKNVLFSGAGRVEGRKQDKYATVDTVPIAPGGENAFEDPGVLEYEEGRVRFAEGSPAAALGIEAIDVSGAGCRPASTGAP